MPFSCMPVIQTNETMAKPTQHCVCFLFVSGQVVFQCNRYVPCYIYVNVSIHLPFPLKSNVFDNGMAGYIVIYITGMFHIASKKLQLVF